MPSAVLLYKQYNISLKNEIIERKTLGKDILIGLAALAVSLIISLLYGFIYSAGSSDLAYKGSDTTVGTTIMKIVSLGVVSGICKEIYFRGFAKTFVGAALGETQALILFSVMFAMLDWYNLGFSLIMGLIWSYAYKKSGHLITSMIAHGGANLAAIIYVLVTSGVM